MKRSILFFVVVFVLALSAGTASATLYTYSGTGTWQTVSDGSFPLQVSMTISDQLTLARTDEPVQVTPGVPLPSGNYMFDIYNWQMSVNGTTFTGPTGDIRVGIGSVTGSPTSELIDGMALNGYNSYAARFFAFGLRNNGEFIFDVNDPLYGKLGTDLQATAGEMFFNGIALNLGGISFDVTRQGSGSVPESVPEPVTLIPLGAGMLMFAWFFGGRKKVEA